MTYEEVLAAQERATATPDPAKTVHLARATEQNAQNQELLRGDRPLFFVRNGEAL